MTILAVAYIIWFLLTRALVLAMLLFYSFSEYNHRDKASYGTIGFLAGLLLPIVGEVMLLTFFSSIAPPTQPSQVDKEI